MFNELISIMKVIPPNGLAPTIQREFVGAISPNVKHTILYGFLLDLGVKQ
jgi:hypothetical protein